MVQLFRPPGTVVPGRPYVLLLFIIIFSTRDLPGPWTDLLEILAHVQKHVQFKNAVQKNWKSAPPQKKLGGNTLNLARFRTPSHFEPEYLRKG